MNTYNGYLANNSGNVLPVEEALQIYENLTKTVAKCESEDAEELFGNVILKACKYAAVRCEWEFMTWEERSSEDSGRTVKHNAFIDSLNILARFLNREGIETPWFDALGDERKRIGDFACFIAYITGISNR